MQFAFSPIWGRWSDKIGRKPIILVGLLGSCLSYVTLALAGSLVLLFVARIIGGIAGANVPTAQAYIADITTPEDRARGMGLMGAAFGLGFIFGPAIGGLLSRVSPETPMWCAAALCLANFVAAWFLLPESRSVTATTKALGRMEAFRHAMSKPTLLLVLALYFIVTMAFSAFEATFALFSEARFGYTAASIGFLFAFIGVVLALIQGVLVGRVVKRVGERTADPAGDLPDFDQHRHAAVCVERPDAARRAVPAGRRHGLQQPVAVVDGVASCRIADDQGGTLGLASSLASLGRVVGPAWGGYLYDAYGMTTPYLSAAALMFFAVVVVVRRAGASK